MDPLSVSGQPPAPPLTTPTTGGPAGSGRPEAREQALPPESAPAMKEVEVIPESPEISPEMAEHIERVIRGEIELPGPIEAGTHEGRPVSIQPAAPSPAPRIILPVVQGDLQAGQSQPVSSSFRWLIEWVKWIIKKYPGRAMYRAE